MLNVDPPDPASSAAESTDPAQMNSTALPEALKALGDAMKNEETRFSNLNTRAVAIISASSVITALAGLFAKEYFASTLKDLDRLIALIGITTAVACLLLATAQIVLDVLRPKPRSIFGANPLVGVGQLPATAEAVQRIVYAEYLGIWKGLVDRNREKAEALTRGYLLFMAAVLAIGGTIIVLAWRTY